MNWYWSNFRSPDFYYFREDVPDNSAINPPLRPRLQINENRADFFSPQEPDPRHDQPRREPVLTRKDLFLRPKNVQKEAFKVSSKVPETSVEENPEGNSNEVNLQEKSNEVNLEAKSNEVYCEEKSNEVYCEEEDSNEVYYEVDRLLNKLMAISMEIKDASQRYNVSDSKFLILIYTLCYRYFEFELRILRKQTVYVVNI